jgi:hypothetical protein
MAETSIQVSPAAPPPTPTPAPPDWKNYLQLGAVGVAIASIVSAAHWGYIPQVSGAVGVVSSLVLYAVVRAVKLVRRVSKDWESMSKALKSLPALQTDLTMALASLRSMEVPLGDVKKDIAVVHRILEQDRAAVALKRFLGLESDDGAEVVMCYSHRDDAKHDRNEAKGRGERVPLNDDEADLTMRLWAIVAPVLRWERVHLRCSCELEAQPERDRIKNSNLILLGSSRFNPLTADVMRGSASPPIRFDREKEVDITDGPSRYSPNSVTEDDKKLGRLLTDYGMIARLRSPWNGDRHLFIFAGCKAAGQLAVERLLLDPGLLQSELERARVTTESVQILLRVQYKWGERLPALEGPPAVLKVQKV